MHRWSFYVEKRIRFTQDGKTAKLFLQHENNYEFNNFVLKVYWVMTDYHEQTFPYERMISQAVMSRFATTDSWDANTGLTCRNRILWNKLGKSEPVSNLGARERIEELYKRIRYTLIYFYKIRDNNTKC